MTKNKSLQSLKRKISNEVESESYKTANLQKESDNPESSEDDAEAESSSSCESSPLLGESGSSK